MTDQSGAAEAAPEEMDLTLDDNIETSGQEEATPADDAGADTVEAGEGEQPKPKQTAQERIDELTRARRDAEREAEFWKAKATPAKEAEPAPKPATDEEPDPADFQFGETDPGYVKALGAHAARQEFQRLRQQDQQTTTARTMQQADADRRAEFAKDHPDFHDKIASNWECTPVMVDALTDSEHGPAVAYHLANNPDEARRIAALSPLAQIRAIGKIEASVAPAATSTIPAKTASDAPPIPTSLRGTGGKFETPGDTDDLDAFSKRFFKK